MASVTGQVPVEAFNPPSSFVHPRTQKNVFEVSITRSVFRGVSSVQVRVTKIAGAWDGFVYEYRVYDGNNGAIGSWQSPANVSTFSRFSFEASRSERGTDGQLHPVACAAQFRLLARPLPTEKNPNPAPMGFEWRDV